MNDLLERLTGLRITRAPPAQQETVEEYHDAEEHNTPVIQHVAPANIPNINNPNVPALIPNVIAQPVNINAQPFIMPLANAPVVPVVIVAPLPVAPVIPPVVAHLDNVDVQEHIRAISWTDAGRKYNLTRRAFRNACNNPQMAYARSNVEVIKRDLAFIRSILRQDRNINQLSPAQLAWLRDIQARVAR